MSPVFLVPGNSNFEEWWGPEKTRFVEGLEERYLVHHAMSFQVPNQNTTDKNALWIGDRPSRAARSFGADSIHLVAHSKGGLDARRWLAKNYHATAAGGYPAVSIVSLITLATPHNGSPLADLMEARHITNRGTPAFYASAGGTLTPSVMLLASLRDANDGYPSLVTSVCAGVNSTEIPALPQSTWYGAVIGDMDLNLSGGVGNPGANDDGPELDGLLRDEDPDIRYRTRLCNAILTPGVITDCQHFAANTIYQFLKATDSVTMARGPLQTRTTWITTPYPIAVTLTLPLFTLFAPPLTQTAADRRNDILVQIGSGRGAGSFERVRGGRSCDRWFTWRQPRFRC